MIPNENTASLIRSYSDTMVTLGQLDKELESVVRKELEPVTSVAVLTEWLYNLPFGCTAHRHVLDRINQEEAKARAAVTLTEEKVLACMISVVTDYVDRMATEDDTLDTLNLDSLDLVEVVINLEEQLDVDIPELEFSQIERSRSLREWSRYVLHWTTGQCAS